MEKAGEFQDWELLQNSDLGAFVKSSDLEEIEGDSEGVIRSDYFTLDSEKRYARTVAEGDVCDEGSVESDNPSWVDPCLEARYGDDAKREVGFQGIVIGRKNSGEFWSDSSSDKSVSRKFNEFEGKNETGFVNDEKREVGFEGIGEIEPQGKNSGEFCLDSGGDGSVPAKFVGAEGEDESDLGNRENTKDESEFSAEVEGNDGGVDGLDSAGFVEGRGGEVPEVMENLSAEEVKSGEEEKGRMVWWKLPLELLKFCVFRVKPVWSFSIAAAVLGFVILGRRLYKLKRKSRSIPLNVTVEDKKVSQFMSRAARLNEAFSVVRRVPIVRPTLPAAGLTPWPVMSLR